MDSSVPTPASDGVPQPGQPSPPSDPSRPAPVGPPKEPGFFAGLLDTKASLAFLIVVLAIFFLEWREAPNLRAYFPPSIYVKYGGFDYGFVHDGGEYWRFLSALFVPRSGIDAFIYLFIFFGVGPPLERMLGTVRFCVLYMTAGAAGVAVGDMVDPGIYTYGTILVVYATLGGIPGAILGQTGSLRATLKSGGGALGHVAFWIVLGWWVKQWSVVGSLSAAILGAALGWGLGGWQRNKALALVKTAIPLGLAIVSLALVVQGFRWLDGGVVPRDSIRPGGGTRTRLAPDAHPSTDPTPEADRVRTGASQASEFLERIGPKLDAFGPLPSGHGLRDRDFEQIQGWLYELEEALGPDSLILGELDGLRVRCLILLGRHHEAASLADEFLATQPAEGRARARALAGVAYFHKAGQSSGAAAEQAERYLESALLEPGLETDLVDARYYYGVLLYQAHKDTESAEQFRRYLELVGDDEDAQPAFRAPLVRQAKIQLDR